MMAKVITVTVNRPGLHSKFVRRRKHVADCLIPSLHSVGIDASVFPAIIGSEVPVKNGVALFDGLSITLGEGCIGNLLSNYKLWSLSVTSGEPVLILEDDAILPEANRQLVKDAITEFLKEPGRSDILYLLSQSPFIKDRYKTYSATELSPINWQITRLFRTQDLSCTAAYLVTPASAKALMNRITQFKTAPTDGYVHRAFRAGEIGVVVQTDPTKGFMLNDNWAEWNHKHDPLVAEA